MITRRRALAAASALPLAGSPLVGSLAGWGTGTARAAGASTLTITRQPSIIYMPTYLMEGRRMIEAEAARLGVPGLTVKWVTFNGGGAATDALLAGSVDMVDTGCGNMLLLWDRTRGRVKGIVATCAEPLVLVTRDPRIRTLADYRPGDKIAVPTIKVSTQAILLQIAAVKMYGNGDADHFDAMTVQLGHPDALAALANPRGEITSHFSAPPFFAEELRRIPGAHIVTDSTTILGEPLSQAVLFTTTTYAAANPQVVAAARTATEQAVALIRDDTEAAVRTYREVSGDPMSATDLLALLRQPGMLDFYARPQGSMRFATHLHDTGVLKMQPKAWTDYFLPGSADLQGS